jgi:hypothetical protein
MLETVKITQFEMTGLPKDPACMHGCAFLLAFTAADTEDFATMVELIKTLPIDERQWSKPRSSWWISAAALHMLRRRYGGFDMALGRFEQAQRQQRSYSSSSYSYDAGADRDHWRQPQPSRLPAAVSAAFNTLYLTADAPEAVINAVHRALQKMHHPDTPTANLQRAQAINAAYDTAKEWRAKNPAA